MIWVLLLIVSLALSFALSGLESAVVAVSRVRVRHAAGEGDPKAMRLLPLIEERDALIGSITVANHVTNLIAFVIIAWKFVDLSGAWGYVTAFLVGLPVFLIGLEVLPKKLFRKYPFRSIRTLTSLVLLVGCARPLFRVLRPKKTAGDMPVPKAVPEQSAGRDELRRQAEALHRQGHLSQGAHRLVQQLLDYRKLRVEDVMQPLTRSVALAGELSISAALILAREHGCSALPVLAETGKFVGVLDLSTLPPNLPPDRLVRHHMRALDAFHDQDSAMATLQSLRRRGRNLALVLNNAEEPVGLISEQDLLGHLMGA